MARGPRTMTFLAVLVVALGLCSAPAALAAEQITVTSTAATLGAGPAGQCTLRDALVVANTPSNPSLTSAAEPGGAGAAADCAGETSGSGAPYTVVLSEAADYTLTAPDNYWFGPDGLPPISAAVTIKGNGATIERSSLAPPFRLFYVSGGISGIPKGELTLQDLTLSGGLAHGGNGLHERVEVVYVPGNFPEHIHIWGGSGGGGAGMGGAIFDQGTLALQRVTLSGNHAQGGDAAAFPEGAFPWSGGGGIGESVTGDDGGGFGGPAPGAAMGAGGAGSGHDGGGGGGFRSVDSGLDLQVGGGQGGLGGDCGACDGGLGGFSFMVGTGWPGGAGGSGGKGGPCGTVCGGGGGGGGVGGGGGDGDDEIGGAGGFGGGGGGLFSRGGFGGGGGGSEQTHGGESGMPYNGGFGGGRGVLLSVQPNPPEPWQLMYFGGGGAGMGGAIFSLFGEVTVSDSTLSGNGAIGGSGAAPEADGSPLGGAIFNLNGVLHLAGSTLAGNTAAGGCGAGGCFGCGSVSCQGGVYSLAFGNTITTGTATTATVTIGDSILYDNTGSDLSLNKVNGKSANASTSLITSPSIVGTTAAPAGTTASGTPITADPALGPLQDNGGGASTMKPGPGAAIGAGTGCDAADEPGNPRPANGCDLGALQVVSAVPTVTTEAATAPTQTSGTLHGQVNPKGSAARYSFQMSTNSAFSTPTTSTFRVGTGASQIDASQEITGLSPATTYFYRLVATNSAGTATGATMQFTTVPLSPTVTVLEPSPVTLTEANLRAALDTKNGETFYLFQLTTDPTFTSFQTYGEGFLPPSGSAISVNVVGLTPETTYYYRAFVLNGGGAAYSSVQTFATKTPVPVNITRPSIQGVATVGETLSVSPGTWSNETAGTGVQWLDCDTAGQGCVPFTGATAHTHTLRPAEVGHTVIVVEAAANGGGISPSAYSDPTAVVVPAGGGGDEEGGGDEGGGAPGGSGPSGDGQGGGGSGAGSNGGGASGGHDASPGDGPSAPTVSAGQIAAQIAPSGKSAKIDALAKADAFPLTFKAPAPGTLVVEWLRPAKGKASPLLVAAGKARFAVAGTAKVAMKLTAAGRALLKRSKSLRLSAQSKFTPTDGTAVTATKAFVLRR